MKLGDLLEILGAVCFIAAGAVAVGAWLALLIAGIAFVYEGQCYGATALPKVKLPKVPHIDPLDFSAARRRRREEAAEG